MAKETKTIGTNTAMAVAGIPEADIKKYHELGLGRGVDVTDSEMWKNKSSFVVRKIACKPELNILMTNECGSREAYMKEVSSFQAQQQAIQLSLDEPTSRFKIGMDAHYSKSTTSATLIDGEKIETRSISFRSDFQDIPLYTTMHTLSLDLHPDIESSDSTFERHLCSWLLQRIRDRVRKTKQKVKSLKKTDPSENPIKKLTNVFGELLESSDPEEREKRTVKVFTELLEDCKDFLTNMGITHYVSSIKLGAMAYASMTIKSEQKAVKGGVEAGVEGAAKGGISGSFAKGRIQKEQHKKLIGRLNVDEDPSGEAVIGFQVQPIDVLVHSQFLHWTLRRAIKEYIQLKTDKVEGPFLISCKVNEKPVYWTVDKKEKHVVGTLSIDSASLFYIKPSENPTHPCDFVIMYYGEDELDRKILMHLADPHVRGRGYESLLPYYVSTNTTIWGFSDKPLELKVSVEASQAQFSLHERVQSSFACFMCRSTPVSMSSWLEGEQFYIKCSQHSLKMDGYIAMKESCTHATTHTQTATSTRTRTAHTDRDLVETTHTENTSKYYTATVFGIKDPNDQGVGMLFRLHPKDYKSLLPVTEKKRAEVEATDAPGSATISEHHQPAHETTVSHHNPNDNRGDSQSKEKPLDSQATSVKQATVFSTAPMADDPMPAQFVGHVSSTGPSYTPTGCRKGGRMIYVRADNPGLETTSHSDTEQPAEVIYTQAFPKISIPERAMNKPKPRQPIPIDSDSETESEDSERTSESHEAPIVFDKAPLADMPDNKSQAEDENSETTGTEQKLITVETLFLPKIDDDPHTPEKQFSEYAYSTESIVTEQQPPSKESNDPRED